MNIKKLSLASATSLMMMGVMTVSALAVGTNGSFELGTDPGVFTQLPAGSTNITDWTVADSGVDYIGSYWPASDGVRSIDLNALNAGSISQDLTTIIGATYDVDFYLSGNPGVAPAEHPEWTSPSDKIVRVSAVGVTNQLFNYDTAVELNTLSDMKWSKRTFTFVATGTTTTLKFESQIVGAFGPALDNVTLIETPVITPTPTPTISPTPTVTPTPVVGKDACKNGGWKNISGLSFKNQGDCVSFYATLGKNQPAGH